MSKTIRIGTRGSPLALAQATIVRRTLVAAGFAADDLETVIIRTSGDRIQDRSLSEIGGKGLFTKEIEEALIAGGIDLAVHSLKDLPAWMPDGLGLGAVLERADPRDALLSPIASTIAELPQGARVGTSSPRRKAMLLNRRPDLEIVDFRGNVGTRLAKLDAGEVQATLLAMAGMARLGLDTPRHAIDPEEMLPAACQGAIGIEIRLGDAAIDPVCAALNHAPSAIAVAAERAFLSTLDGSCRTPIAGLATVADGNVRFDGLVASLDGTLIVRRGGTAPLADAADLGTRVGTEIRAAMPPDFFLPAHA